jgi:hypothetical protein
MKTIVIAATISIAIALAASTTAVKDIVAVHASTSKFQAFDCDQLREGSLANIGRSFALANELADFNRLKSFDIVKDLGAWWWTLPFVQLRITSKEQEYARLKGEYEALQHLADQKQCPIGTIARP